MTQILLVVRIDEGVDEIGSIKKVLLVLEKLVDVCVRSTGVGVVRRICAPADRYF
jgi:hypothetical protein